MKTKKIYDFSANDMTTIKSPRKTTIINKNKSIVTYDFKSRKPKNSSVINKIINQKKVNKKIVNIKTEVEDLFKGA